MKNLADKCHCLVERCHFVSSIIICFVKYRRGTAPTNPDSELTRKIRLATGPGRVKAQATIPNPGYCSLRVLDSIHGIQMVSWGSGLDPNCVLSKFRIVSFSEVLAYMRFKTALEAIWDRFFLPKRQTKSIKNQSKLHACIRLRVLIDFSF